MKAANRMTKVKDPNMLLLVPHTGASYPGWCEEGAS